MPLGVSTRFLPVEALTLPKPFIPLKDPVLGGNPLTSPDVAADVFEEALVAGGPPFPGDATTPAPRPLDNAPSNPLMSPGRPETPSPRVIECEEACTSRSKSRPFVRAPVKLLERRVWGAREEVKSGRPSWARIHGWVFNESAEGRFDAS